jgi:magnesium-transporting ATPase (P-type)
LPAIIWLYLSFIAKGSLIQFIDAGFIQAPVPEDIAQSIAILKMQINNVTFAVLVPLSLLAALGLSGAFHVVQKLVYAENVDVKADFKDGIRRNWKEYMVMALLLSLSLFFYVFVTGYYAFEPNLAIKAISIAIAVVQLTVVSATLFVAFPYFNLYKSRMGRGLWQCLALFFNHPGRGIALLTLAAVPFALLVIPVFWLQTAAGILLMAFIFSFDAALMILYSNDVFDRHVNPGRYDGLIDKGLMKNNR